MLAKVPAHNATLRIQANAGRFERCESLLCTFALRQSAICRLFRDSLTKRGFVELQPWHGEETDVTVHVLAMIEPTEDPLSEANIWRE